MKRNYVFRFTAVTAVCCAFIAACSDDDNPVGSTESYTTATITHMGFDFSEGKADTTINWNESKNDGETITWTPIGERQTDGVWFRTRVDPNRTQSLGKVDISSVKSVDTSEGAWDTQPPALSKDDVVIAECLDGYVKFKVIADVDILNLADDWGVKVSYLFSPEPSFPK